MAMNAIEKSLARASSKDSVRPGDVVYPIPDRVLVHDGYIEMFKKQMDELGVAQVANPEKVVFVTDHEVIYLTPRAAARGAAIRAAARALGVGQFFDAGRGGHGHIFPMEKGMVLPGQCIMANDTHCSNFGAIGAIPFSERLHTICVLVTGTVWTVVPNVVHVTLNGRLAKGVYSRDVGYWLTRQLTKGKDAISIDYRYLELGGTAIEGLTVDELVGFINSPSECGAAGVFIPPSASTLAWVRGRTSKAFSPIYSDPDATYEHEFTYDISDLPPQIATPGSPANAVDINDVEKEPVQHAYIGSCGSGMYHDLEIAANMLRGRKIDDRVRLLITPGTVDSAVRMAAEGLSAVFEEAGAIVLPAGCGPCAGGNMGPMTDNEVSISTAATNHAGRMGPQSARCFLGSPATVTASAITGRITDPREFL